MGQTTMVVIAAVVLALPFVLMLLFNRRERADSRGRRTTTAWYVQRR